MSPFYSFVKIAEEILSPQGWTLLGCDLAAEKRALFQNQHQSRLELTLGNIDSEHFQFVLRYRTLDYFYVETLIDSSDPSFKNFIAVQAKPEHQMLVLRDILDQLTEQYLTKFKNDESLYNYLVDQYLLKKRRITKDFFLYYYKIYKSEQFKQLDWIEHKMKIVQDLLKQKVPVEVYNAEDALAPFQKFDDLQSFSTYFKKAL